MADGGSDWTDWIDDALDWIDTLFGESDPPDSVFECIIAATFRQGDTPEKREAIRNACIQRFGEIDLPGTGGGGSGGGGGGSGGGFDFDDFLDDLNDDIGGLLDGLLGSIDADLSDIFDTLEDALRDGIGNIGSAGARTVGDIGDIAGAVLGQVGLSSERAIDIVGLSAGSAIETVGGVLGDITAGVGETIEDFLRTIRDAIENAINAMTGAITTALNRVIDVIGNVVEGLIATISDAVRNAINTVTEFVNRIIDNVEGLINRAITNITEITDRVFTAVAETVENIRVSLVEAFNRVTEFIGDQIERAGAFIDEATQAISALGDNLLANAEEIYNVITDGLGRGIDSLVSVADSALAVTRESLDNLFTALTSAVEQAGPIVQNAIAASPIGIAATGLTALRENVVGFLEETLSGPTEDLQAVLVRMGLPAEGAARIASVYNTIVEGNPLFRGAFILWLIFQISSAFGQQIAQAASLKALQDMQPLFPVALPDASATQELQRLGLMSDEEAQQTYIKNGFAPHFAERLTALKRRLPEIGIIQVWWLRKFIDTEQAKAMLGELGLQSADTQRILDMAFFIPPVNDLITMSVREVFSPDIRDRFQLDESFPENFAGFAEQQGLSEEWARNYWAAHWTLPSIQMGFEMLHRRVITEDDLDLLLRTQDVMPFWREAIKKISFAPLTRVDVRRMHKLGVLTEQEVKDAYKDIGYDETNAERLLQFTIELNADTTADTPESLEDLTRSAVISLFKRGTFTRDQAFDLLRSIGLGEDAANIFIDIAELETEADDRDTQTKLVIDQAKLGIITFDQAQDELAALGLEPVEVQRALVDLQRARDSATKIPNRQELDSMLRADAINDTVYLTTMVRNGYSLVWAERFLQVAKNG